MKLLFENWRRFLTEVTFATVEEESLSDERLYKYLKAARWDFNNKEQLRKSYGPGIPDAADEGVETPTIRMAKGTILKFIPNDIEEKYRGIALLWFIKVVLKDALGEPERHLRLGVFDGPWGSGINPEEPWQPLGMDAMQDIIGGLLETFFLRQDFMPENDINKIKTLKELYDIVEAARPAIEAYQKDQLYFDAEKGKLIIYEDDNWQIIIPETKGAACDLGSETDWCTAVKDSKYYEHYHKPDDPLIIFVEKVERGNIEIHKEDKEAEIKLKINLASKKVKRITIALYNERKEKVKEFKTDFEKIITFDTNSLAPGTYHYVVKISSYQFHFGSGSFMDLKDKRVDEMVKVKLLALLKKADYDFPKHVKDQLDKVEYKEFPDGRKITRNSAGEKRWLLNDKLHRVDGPALEMPSGGEHWFLNGILHRTDGPAVTYASGTKYWYQNGERHRADGPAVEYPHSEGGQGAQNWYLYGKRHRADGPAVESAGGDKFWYLNGKMHRTDGPAMEFVNGDKKWYLNDKLHRVDGPAMEFADGAKRWFLNGELHRDDGPAVETASGSKLWYLNGKKLSKYGWEAAGRAQKRKDKTLTEQQLFKIIKEELTKFYETNT